MCVCACCIYLLMCDNVQLTEDNKQASKQANKQTTYGTEQRDDKKKNQMLFCQMMHFFTLMRSHCSQLCNLPVSLSSLSLSLSSLQPRISQSLNRSFPFFFCTKKYTHTHKRNKKKTTTKVPNSGSR